MKFLGYEESRKTARSNRIYDAVLIDPLAGNDALDVPRQPSAGGDSKAPPVGGA